MMKKLALVCALVMLVSIVSAFAATSDTPIKTQTKLQQKAKIQDGTCNGDQTQTKLQKKAKIQDGTCNGDQTQTKLQKKLKNGSTK
jgi:Mg2+/Co2+ transporter CorB